MSREEARKRLAGTFGFELQNGMVVVRDESLIEEIRVITSGKATYTAPPQANSAPVGSRSLDYVVRA